MREIWVDIIDYEGHYKISNTGRVKSIKRSTELILNLKIIRKDIYM